MMDGSLTAMYLNQRKTLLEAQTELNEAGYLELQINWFHTVFRQITTGHECK